MPLEPSVPRCAVCGRDDGRRLFESAGYALRACRCGGAYLDPAPTPAVDTVEGHTAAFYSLPAHKKLDWLAQTHPTGRLLEVGCGFGYFLNAAVQHGYEVEGLEPDPRRAKATRDRLGIQVETRPVEQTQLPAESFDVVYHCDLLSHFADPRLALEQMAKLLRPGGVLFFDVGLHRPCDLEMVHERNGTGIPRHRWFYTPDAVHQLLERAELRLVRERHFHLRPQILLADIARKAVPRVPWRKRLVNQGAYQDTYRPGPYSIHESVRNFLRYEVGGRIEWAGPMTGLFIAEQN